MESNNINGSIRMDEAVCTLQETLGDRYYNISNSKMRVLREYVNVIIQLVVPYVMALCHTWIKHQRTLLSSIKRNVITVLLAAITSRFSIRFVSAGEVAYGSSKLDPLLRTFRVINFRPRQLLWNPSEERTQQSGKRQIQEPEKSVHCEILHDPGPDGIRADVIFIHGLKGSLDRTWTQGLWNLKDSDNRNSRVLLRKSCSTSSIRHNSETSHTVSRSHSSNNGLVLTDMRDVREKVFVENNNTITVNQVLFTCGDDGSEDCNNTNNQQNKANESSKATITPESTTETSENKDNKEPVSRCWPKDWLPMDCPGVRIIALNYTTDPYLWRPVWISKRSRTSMCERGWEMIEHLVNLGVGRYPIIWVGHSKGGLFVKQMLVHGCESPVESHMNISLNTKGILFYSVPHRGSPLANLNLPLLRQSIELTEVQKDSAEVLELHKKFRSLLDKNLLNVEVRSFIETTLTLMSLFYVRIVSVESADAEIGDFYGVPTDHRNICKPRSRDCFLYQELVDLIKSVCEKTKT
ncbi:uncharacterized protein LOC142324656 isoform X2 [Lycorma delicatula]|uniref:uncharacterized protein LOC142324656 isoform X2 n=1 Tax=Lycorma delicatula TaxID=130591 RepID=UPI003F50E234